MPRLLKVLIPALLGLQVAFAAPSALAATPSLTPTPPVNLPARGAGPGSSTTATTGGGGRTTPSGGATTTSSGTATTAGGTTTTGSSGHPGHALPHTGMDVVAVAGCGVLLLLGGIAIEVGGAVGGARRSRTGW